MKSSACCSKLKPFINRSNLHESHEIIKIIQKIEWFSRRIDFYCYNHGHKLMILKWDMFFLLAKPKEVIMANQDIFEDLIKAFLTEGAKHALSEQCSALLRNNTMTPSTVAEFGIVMLKAAIIETVRQNPGISTTNVDKNLCIDSLMGGHQKWVAHATLEMLEGEKEVTSEKVGKERQWRISEQS